MEIESTPEFYTGAPVDPVDLRFRGAFVAELWRTLRTGHVVLTAPRRTGKTSVMDYLRHHPENGFSVVSANVQDLTHPADFFQVLLDGFHDAHPDFVRDRLAAGWELVGGALGRVKEVGAGGFKLALRESDPDWRANWRRHGDTFLAQARNTGAPILFIVDEFPDMAHERRQIFNRLLLDLENDFYIVEVAGGLYDFASGVLKSWWRKYHA